MANTYTHRIVSLKKSNEVYLNVVKSVVIEITASDGSNQFSKNYTHPMRPLSGDPDEIFVEYNDLVESDVISWVTSNPALYDIHIKDLDREFKESLQDNVESNFPWS